MLTVSGNEALTDRTFDLIVLDLILPDEDGLDAARRQGKTSNIPVVMLTARGDVHDRIVAMELGLTSTEFGKLISLVDADGTVMRREDIPQAVYGNSTQATDRVIDTHMVRLLANCSRQPKARN